MVGTKVFFVPDKNDDKEAASHFLLFDKKAINQEIQRRVSEREEIMGYGEDLPDPSREEKLVFPISTLNDLAWRIDVPVTSVTSDLNKVNGKLILFASQHNNERDGDYLKDIIISNIKRDREVIVAFESFDSKFIEYLVNNPDIPVESEPMQWLLKRFHFPKVARKVLETFREIQHEYGSRFKIVPIGVDRKISLADSEKIIPHEEYTEYRDLTIVKQVQNLLLDLEPNTVLVVYAGAAHSIDILISLARKRKFKEMKQQTNVFLPPENKDYYDLYRE